MSWDEVFKSLVFWGPGAVIAVIIIAAMYKIIIKVGTAFVEAQKDQAIALGRQAQSMEGLQNSIQNYIAKDNFEHREMLVLLKFTAQHIQDFKKIAEEHITFFSKGEECGHLIQRKINESG